MKIMQIHLFLLLSFISLTLSLNIHIPEQSISALFVFGDSVVDVGSNDWSSSSLDKSNFLPYGVDFPQGPTGRYTNGRNPTDIIGQLLGLPRFPRAYEDPATDGPEILYGVNYAIAGAGILEPRWSEAANYGLKTQITRFRNVTLPQLQSLKNDSSELASYLSRSIFVFNSGANDFEQRCFMSSTTSRKIIKECDVPMFTGYLLKYLSKQLKRLFEVGARKFVFFSLMPIGCSPSSRDGAAECVEEYNEAALFFNTQLNASVANLTSQNPGASIVVVNSYGILYEIFDNLSALGFKVDNESCCTTSGMRCENGSTPCTNRHEYVYFDGIHPTESAYLILSTKAYESDLPHEVYPFNVSYLAAVKTNSTDPNASSGLLSGPWASRAIDDLETKSYA